MTNALLDYEKVYREFSWDTYMNQYLDWPGNGYFNITHEAIDRHAEDPKKVAIFYISADGREEKYTFREMKNLTSQHANMLRNLGVEKGDSVARMLPRSIENYITFLGTWKAGAIDVPVFTAYGPEALEYRAKSSKIKMLITDAENRPKVERISGGLPGVKIVVVSGPKGEGLQAGDYDYWKELSGASRQFDTARMKADDVMLVHYTSGTTGAPKGAMINEKGAMFMIPFSLYSLSLKKDDMFWGFADPGWIYALFTVGTSVLIAGGSLLVYGGRMDAENWYNIMDKYEVTNFAAAPTLYRMIMAAGDDLAKSYKESVKAWRYTSAGEYLDPKVSQWFKEKFGVGISDQYGLTEVGIVLGNYPFMLEKPGSMGRPVPGFEVRVLEKEGNAVAHGETGIVMVKKNDFFLGCGYLNEPARWQECFVNGEWYNTGDMAVMDDDGYFFYMGRDDDIISSSGYRIGPAEVEGAVMKHPSVAEVAAVGKPDPLRTENVVVFVVLKSGHEPSAELAEEIQKQVKSSYAAHIYPREVEFVSELPKTESGKIMRRELRKRFQ
ncbi:acyl-CoA synthetase [Chloroflexota bacterium]